jgi:predicted GIY-YIG superfamily endonuclease
MFYVYQHLRLDNNKPFYIGKGCKDRAWRKKRNNIGWNNIANKVGFKVEILKYFDDENQAIEYEHQLINIYREQKLELINQTKYSSGGTKWSYTDEIKYKQSKGQMGTKRPKTKEWCEKISKANKGRSILWANKIGDALRGKPKNYLSKHKPIAQYDLQDNLLNEYQSAQDAGRCLGKSGNSIADCAAGRQKTAYGYIWKYL